MTRDKRLVLMIGLPRSGKSTLANKMGYPIVSRDAIRMALHGKPFLPEAEQIVTSIEEYMVRSLFIAGHNTVVVDACHVQRRQRDRWRSKHWVREFYWVNTSPDICHDRADETDQDYLHAVIARMSKQFDPLTEEEMQCLNGYQETFMK